VFRKQLQPLTEGDKAILVLSYLEESGVINPADYKDLSSDEVNNLVLGTSHYTLINALEIFFLYRENSHFRDHINKLASQYKISLKNLPLSPKFLIRLGYTFISSRPNLTEDDRNAIADKWTDKYKDLNLVFDREEAFGAWVNDIVLNIQLYETSQQQSNETTYEQYISSIYANTELKERYLSLRELS
jgi:hypothetical protein